MDLVSGNDFEPVVEKHRERGEKSRAFILSLALGRDDL
jgi:hypothetical protein